ncbi:hypothetical protein B0H16DRAFT_1478004 [Mycena metata]|uniref:Uncharacterized protein n=1 Tax=Mycena metata TaxID=1033252 RepID=A0AAD7H7N8_9AGAR|nr:hypothetical protein B0H16DRAFT_1478004 [Mycena metata]
MDIPLVFLRRKSHLNTKYYSKGYTKGCTKGTTTPRQIPIYAGWYTDPNIPSPWLMDWPNWEALTLFYESIDGTLIVDKLFKEVYDVPGAITPLAYMMGISPDLHFLFFAAGRYYLYDSGDLYLSD